MTKRMIVDVSSILWTGMFSGKDEDTGREVIFEEKKVWVNGWEYAYENAIKYITSMMGMIGVTPHDVILVEEGKMSKTRRLAWYPDYKKGDNRPPESYEEFNKAKAHLIAEMRNVGACAVKQDGVEADDVIAYLAKELSGRRVILTNDGDLSALIADQVTLIRKGALVTENPYGPFPTTGITTYKAVVGDSSDNIKGAHGFGKGAFMDFLVWAGDEGLAALEGMIKRSTLHELIEDVPAFKPIKKIVDSADSVYTSYKVAKLYPEWVNTMRQPLIFAPGMVKGLDVVTHELLRKYAQKVRLITTKEYDEAIAFMKSKIAESPVVGLDIETSTPEESDEWLTAGNRESKVDVFGSELTSMGLTFGSNGQYTYFFSVDHLDTANLTSEQVRDAVALVPQEIPLIIQNFGFEAVVLYQAWAKAWRDNGWHGYLPNVIDTMICSSYVDENIRRGLKNLSSHYLGYQQETYDEVTKKRGLKGTLTGGRIEDVEYVYETKLVVHRNVVDVETQQVEVTESWVPVLDEEGNPVVKETWEARRYKMNELTAQHVLSYGADDPICTVALFHFFKIVMEIEKTWDVMLEVEQLPAYVLAHGHISGVKFNLEKMKGHEREDRETYEKNWAVVRQFLIDIGHEGTVCPQYETLDAAAVKEATRIILDREILMPNGKVTTVRTVPKLAKLIEMIDHEDAALLAQYVENNNVAQINDWMKSRFAGEPVLDTDSPTQMKKFLYDTLGLPVRVVGSATATERQKKPELAKVVQRYKRIWAGSTTETPLSPADMELLKAKAKTNEIALGFALLMDADNPNIGILKHIQAMKKCETRQKLYYTPYANLRHWKDNKIHASIQQSAQATLRNTASDPNLTQLPKKGEGVKVRENFEAHHKDAVVCSIDFTGQELRQAAGQSGDKNMLACFVGDNLKDMHSLTASGAMKKKWGAKVVADLFSRYADEGMGEYEFFMKLRKLEETAKMADDLRKNAKNVNFGAQYDAQAPKLAETLIIPVADAEAFLQAKYAMFPRFEEWKEEVKAQAQSLGYVTTCMGARRHLRESLMSDEWGVADKALRQGPNFRIQGSSAEQTKLAMGRLWKSGILFKLDMAFFAPIHDELVWSVHRDHAIESIRVIKECMEVPYGNLPVPFIGSISLGPNFGKQIECGEEFDPVRIQKAIDSVFEKQAA